MGMMPLGRGSTGMNGLGIRPLRLASKMVLGCVLALMSGGCGGVAATTGPGDAAAAEAREAGAPTCEKASSGASYNLHAVSRCHPECVVDRTVTGAELFESFMSGGVDCRTHDDNASLLQGQCVEQDNRFCVVVDADGGEIFVSDSKSVTWDPSGAHGVGTWDRSCDPTPGCGSACVTPNPCPWDLTLDRVD
jgi:hypothetical protein